MNLYEHLSKLNENDLQKIAKKLHCLAEVDNNFTNSEYIRRIHRALNNRIFDILSNKDEDIKINDSILLDLKKLCFNAKNVMNESVTLFRGIGIVYQNTVVPDDIKAILTERWRADLIHKIEDGIIEVKPSPFLIMVLVLGLIRSNSIKEYDDLINLGFENKRVIKSIVSYLEDEGFVKNAKEGIEISEDKLKFWVGHSVSSLRHFYKYYLGSYFVNVIELLDTIQMLQKEEYKLISTKDADFILCEYEEEIEGLINMGLIRKVIKENIVYIQLAPETWYMTTGQRPTEWLEENIIITPDFEVFIPYYFNPLVVDMFGYYGKLKNSIIEKQMLKSSKTKNKSRKKESKKNKYRYYISMDDYFLVFDIEECKKVENKVYTYSNFYEALKCNMPDIVREEIEKSFE